MYVRTGYEDEFLTRLGGCFAEDNEVTYLDMSEGDSFYRWLSDDLLRIGPHIVHSTAYRHPLFVSQIVTGIPTIVEVTDDLKRDRERFVRSTARQAVTSAQLEIFTMMQASCLVTSRENVGALGVYNAHHACIPKPLDPPEVSLADQCGQVGLVGRGEMLHYFIDEQIDACTLSVDHVRCGSVHDKLCCIIVEPGYEVSLMEYRYLCTLGVPVVLACNECVNLGAYRFLEYSTDNLFDSVMKVWHDLADMSVKEYEDIVARTKLVGAGVSMDAVYKLYAGVYERAIDAARIRMPVRGW